MRAVKGFLIWLLATVIIAIPIGLVSLIGLGMLGVPVTVIVAPLAGLAIIRHSKEVNRRRRQEQEAYILQKITAGVPLTDQEKNIHAEMVAQASPKK